MNEYQMNYQKEKEKQLAMWKDMVVEMLGEVPNSKTITNPLEIIEILSKIGESKASNHTFLPSGGGLDLTDSGFSKEDGKIELRFGSSTKIIKPKALIFHAVGDNPEWWYFRIETLSFERTGIYKEPEIKEDENTFKSEIDKRVAWQMSYSGEELLEVVPGEYMDRSYWDLDHLGYDEDGNETPIPDHARIIDRHHPGGAFVIFPKYSKYNNNSSTYDGRHNKGTNEEFKVYIQKIVKGLEEKM